MKFPASPELPLQSLNSMKSKTISKFGAASIAAFVLTSAAHALPYLNGVINMGTNFSVLGAGIKLQNAGGAVTTNLATAAGVKTWVGAIVTSSSGSFATALPGSPVSFAQPWVFANPYTPLWSVGGFTFDLTSSMVTHLPSFLLVEGTGLLHAPGFADTPGFWTFSTQGSAAQGVFSWSSSTNSVPDGGATVALLGFALLGLHGVRRKLAAH
jgi:hypothetical protein